MATLRRMYTRMRRVETQRCIGNDSGDNDDEWMNGDDELTTSRWLIIDWSITKKQELLVYRANGNAMAHKKKFDESVEFNKGGLWLRISHRNAASRDYITTDAKPILVVPSPSL